MLAQNQRWAKEMVESDPDYFKRHLADQRPTFLFITCSDSRVPVQMVTGTDAGEMFVHRNIANQVFSTDLNVMAVVDYAIHFLDVAHVVVCGHTGCGGVRASFRPGANGLVDHWLGPLRTIRRLHAADLAALPDEAARVDRLVDLNVLEQVRNLAELPTVRDAWERGPRPILHGTVYELATGRLRVITSGIRSVADPIIFQTGEGASAPLHVNST